MTAPPLLPTSISLTSRRKFVAKPTMAAVNLQVTDLAPFENTVAGHAGVLSDSAGDLIIKPCTAAEVEFYEACATHPIFNAVVPTFMGTLSLSSDPQRKVLEEQEHDPVRIAAALQASNAATSSASILHGRKLDTQQAIVLENIAAGFHKPNILDVKLGIRLWADDAPPEKRNKLDRVSSETTSGSLGFRIAGMRIWRSKAEPGAGEFQVYDKAYGRQFTAQNIREGFEEYFFLETNEDNDRRKYLSPARREVLRRLSNEVGTIQDVLENEESRMYSASILFAYEGDLEILEALLAEEGSQGSSQHTQNHPSRRSSRVSELEEAEEDEDEAEGGELRICAASLIDFAHASFTPGEGPDENALRGVRNVRAILDSILLSS